MDRVLGTFLQTLCTERGVSMTWLAEQAGITRMTLRRWEAGRFQPRLPELEAVLASLGVSTLERTRALALIAAPRAIQQVRTEARERPGPFAPEGTLSAAGDLWTHAFLKMEDRTAAAVWMNRTYTPIDSYDLTYCKVTADILAQQL